jgi:hypothetical protein
MPLKTPFRLVLGFIHDLQFVTTITYSTIVRLHNLQALHTKLLSLTFSSLHIFTTQESYKPHLIMHSKFSLHYNT